jgi:hypothetical protein
VVDAIQNDQPRVGDRVGQILGAPRIDRLVATITTVGA